MRSEISNFIPVFYLLKCRMSGKVYLYSSVKFLRLALIVC